MDTRQHKACENVGVCALDLIYVPGKAILPCLVVQQFSRGLNCVHTCEERPHNGQCDAGEKRTTEKFFLKLLLDDNGCPYTLLDKKAATKLFPATFNADDMDQVCFIPLTVFSMLIGQIDLTEQLLP